MTKKQVTSRYNKNLTSAKAYIPNIVNIIKYCGLLPTYDWKVWTDFIKNNLVLYDKKYKTVEKEFEEFYSSDIYFKSLPDYIYNRSKLVMIVLNNTEESFVLFWGEDEKIRFSCYIDGEWDTNLPPLSAGLFAIETFIENFNIENYTSFSEGSEKIWISKIPMSDNMISEIENEKFGTKLLTSLGAI